MPERGAWNMYLLPSLSRLLAKSYLGPTGNSANQQPYSCGQSLFSRLGALATRMSGPSSLASRRPVVQRVRHFYLDTRTLTRALLGITITHPQPVVKYFNGQGNVANVPPPFYPAIFTHGLFQELRTTGLEAKTKFGRPPSLFVIVLPENGNDIYTAVKQCVLRPAFIHTSDSIRSFGDCAVGNHSTRWIMFSIFFRWVLQPSVSRP